MNVVGENLNSDFKAIVRALLIPNMLLYLKTLYFRTTKQIYFAYTICYSKNYQTKSFCDICRFPSIYNIPFATIIIYITRPTLP